MSDYKYGEPDKYGEFPHIYANKLSEDEFTKLLLERLPASYNMQIVCAVEEQVLSDISTLGIDAHLEAMTMTQKDRVENRMVGNRCIQQHHAFDFTPTGMVCLIRRLKEYNPSKFDHSECEFRASDYDWDDFVEEQYRGGEPVDFWQAADQLRGAILSTLDITQDT